MKTFNSLCKTVLSIASVFIIGIEAFAAEPFADIEGDIPKELHDLIGSVIGTTDAAPRSLAQARRRAEKAAKEAGSVLRSQGYYGAKVDVRITSTDSEVDAKKNKRQPVIQILSGPLFSISEIIINYENTAPDVSEKISNEIKLKAGAPALAADVVAAELNILNTLRSNGFADAAVLPRKAIVDHSTHSMNIHFNFSVGDKVRFGKIIQSGSASVSKQWPQMVASFEQDQVYDERKLNALTSKVLATGAFKGASTELDEIVMRNDDGSVTRNVLLNIDQGKRNTISGELGISTTDGTGVDLVYERRNIFAYADIAQLKSTVKTNEISIGVNYKIPYAWRVDRALDFGAEIASEDTNAFTGERFTTKLLMTQKFDKHFKVGAGIGFEASQYEENFQDTRAYVVEGLGQATYDRRDSILDPKTGYLLEVDITPSYNFGDADGLFTTVATGASYYRKISDEFVVAGRAKAGTIFGSGQGTVPLNRRYYAGGGGSVRGFGYQAISPLNAANEEIGGRSLLESSLELRYHGKSKYGFATFVDAGTVGRSSFSEFETVRYGLGAGLRYYTSFAPLRADIAIPLNKRPDDADVQIYISIGQAF